MPKKKSPAQRAIEGAWLELATTRQVHGDGAQAIEMFVDGATTPEGSPGWFRAMELGLAQDQGPSIFANVATLDVDNRERRRQLAHSEAQADRPKIVARAKRMSPDESRRALRAVLKRAGVTVRKGAYVVLEPRATP